MAQWRRASDLLLRCAPGRSGWDPVDVSEGLGILRHLITLFNATGDALMATQQSAQVSIKNGMGGNASIVLFHNNSSNGTHRGAWDVEPGGTSGHLTVHFETGFDTEDIHACTALSRAAGRQW